MSHNALPPLFLVGCVRSGTTVLHKLLLQARPHAVDLTDDDYESRTFWQAFSLRIGSRVSGTPCLAATRDDVQDEQRSRIRTYVERRGEDGDVLINKNPHLLNKIGFVAEVLPTSRFVFIIREAMSVVSSTKLGFERANVSNESYPPFVHYWPDCELPCWWTVRNDCVGPVLTRGSVRRVVREGCCRLGLKRGQVFTSPGRVFPHEKLSRFREEYPDRSRYYPGEGFARLPEAWVVQNRNILAQLGALSKDRWTTVVYADLVSDVRGTIARILEFAGVDKPQLELVPGQLDRSRSEKWRKALNVKEQEIVRAVIGRDSSGFDALCEQFGEQLLAS